MSSAAFSLLYSGEALRSGLMSVEDLAAALLGTGTLFEEANNVLNGNEVRLNVQVSAQFVKGSFEVNLLLDQHFVEHLMGMFAGVTVTPQQILAFIFGSGGLVGLLKILKAKKAEAVTKQDGGDVTIKTGDGSEVTVNKYVYNIYERPEIRKAIYPIAKPLEHEGIDTLDVKSDNRVLDRIEKADLPSLATPPVEEEILHETSFEASLRIVSISFKENNKWRLSDGRRTYYYAIEDVDFLRKIDQQSELFAKDDILKARVKVVVRRTQEDIIVTDRVLERVLEHTRVPKQIKLQLPIDLDDD